MGALGVVVFAVALLLSIALHELGHLLTAKKFGMKASRYFIGMGPTLWSTWRGETEYGFKAFPIGGFVKIVGMTQLEELEDPRDEPRAFWRQPAGQRAVVLAAGSAMHFVIAFVLLAGATLAFAQPKETTKVGEVSQCLDPGEEKSCAGKPPAPARAAGVRPGDRIVAFEGREIAKWEEFSTATHAHPAGPAELVVLRDGQRVTLNVRVERIMGKDENGAPEEQGRIGVTVGEETERLGPVTAIGRAGSAFGELTVGSLQALVQIPAKLPSLFRDAATDKPRSVEDGGPVSVVDLGRFSAQAFDEGAFVAVIGMIAALNVFIGIFNLLPLLPLDGGHLAILGFEQARSRIAKALGRRDPGRVDLRKLMPAMVGFIVVMGSLTLVLIYAGITNPIANPFSGP